MALTRFDLVASGTDDIATIVIPAQTFTVTVASPAVFTCTAHKLRVGMAVIFLTTGALPTGLTAGTTYYVISAGFGADSFQVSATLGGSAVDTSGTQSGVHTLHAVGDLCVVKDASHRFQTGPTGAPPGAAITSVTPSGFTSLAEVTGVVDSAPPAPTASSSRRLRMIISAKKLDGTETTVTGMASDSSHIVERWRPDDVFSGFAWVQSSGGDGQVTGGNPSVQTIGAASAASLPALLAGHLRAADGSAVNPRSTSPTMTEIASTFTSHYAHHFQYAVADTPADHTYDMDDEGTINGSQSGYLTFTVPQALDIAADVGAFVLSGIDATFIRSRNFLAEVGEFVLTGVEAVLLTSGNFAVMANRGEFILAGLDVALAKGQVVAGAVGTFILTGIDAALTYGVKLVAEVGAFILTGIAASFVKHLTMAAVRGVFGFGGFSLFLKRKFRPIQHVVQPYGLPRTSEAKLQKVRTSNPKLTKI